MHSLMVAFGTVLLGSLGSAFGQIQTLDLETARQIAGGLREFDFEGLARYQFPGTPGEPQLPNPLRFDGLTVFDPHVLQAGFCSSPTCEVDPDNAHGGNIELILFPDATLSFDWHPSVVIVDVQGIGDNPFTLNVHDASGARREINSQGTLFGVTWVSVTSPSGIEGIEIGKVGGTGGPIGIARVLVSDVPEPSVFVLGCLGLLALGLGRRGRLAGGWRA